MIPPVIHVLPRFDNADRPNGFRACAARVPGCVVILKEYEQASAMVTAAVQAIIEENDRSDKN